MKDLIEALSKHKIISVDFDDTLAKPPRKKGGSYDISVDADHLEPIERICTLVKALAEIGTEFHIITYRHPEHLEPVLDFITAHNLPIKSVIPTSGTNKTPHMLGVNSTCHIDDMVEVLVLARLRNIEGYLVSQPHNADSKNCSSKWFPRI